MNKAQAVMYLFPGSKPMLDFIVRDDSDGKGQFIDLWNIQDDAGALVPIPTDTELEAAYAAWEAEEAAKPVPETQEQAIERLGTESVEPMLAVAEVYETSTTAIAAHEQEGVDTMMGLAEAYETILLQQTTIEALTARVAALEGGGV